MLHQRRVGAWIDRWWCLLSRLAYQWTHLYARDPVRPLRVGVRFGAKPREGGRSRPPSPTGRRSEAPHANPSRMLNEASLIPDSRRSSMAAADGSAPVPVVQPLSLAPWKQTYSTGPINAADGWFSACRQRIYPASRKFRSSKWEYCAFNDDERAPGRWCCANSRPIRARQAAPLQLSDRPSQSLR
jgi:hypothetical protein